MLGAICAGQSAGLYPVGAAIPGRFILVYREGAPEAAARDFTGAILLKSHSRLGIAVVQTAASNAESTRAMQQILAQQPGVAFAVADRIVSAHALTVRTPTARAAVPAGPADAFYDFAGGWAVREVGGFGSQLSRTGDTSSPSEKGPWDVTKGEGVRVAILDSGVDARHPDFAPNLVFNQTEVDQTALPSACDDGSPQDQQGHGTWTASLAVGALGFGTGMVAGVAPAATLLNIKVLERMPSGLRTPSDPMGCSAGQASGLLSWVLAGIEDAVEQHADVVSMSLGTLVDLTTDDGPGLKAAFDRVTHAAAQAGVILVASAGNDGLDLTGGRYLELPAQSEDVLAVIATTNPACAEALLAGAVCKAGPVTVPYYSNFGSPLNALAAPGGSYPAGTNTEAGSPSGWIRGACSEGEPSTLDGAPVDAAHSMGCFGLGHTAYVEAMGTSASAPLAAGVAALIRSAHPTWDGATVMQAMRSSAVSLPGLRTPLIDAASALGLPAVANHSRSMSAAERANSSSVP